MPTISYLQYLKQVYPSSSAYQKMLPTGDKNGDSYGNLHIPGTVKIEDYCCHGLLGFGGFASVYDVTKAPSGFFQKLFNRSAADSAPHYACKIADLSQASVNGGDAVVVAQNFLREIELYYKMKNNRVAGLLPIEAHTPIPEIKQAIAQARKSPSHTVHTKLMMLTPVAVSYSTYLDSMVRSGKLRQLTTQQACAMFLDIAEAVLQLHSHGILHRDLKPDNIYLYSEHGTLRALLADFNVSKAVRIQNGMHDLTEISYGGTAAYASPYLRTHQLSDLPREVALKLDTYSLGVIFYIILNNLTLGNTPPKYSPSKKLSDLVMRMMEPDPYKTLSMEDVVKNLYKIYVDTLPSEREISREISRTRIAKPEVRHPYIPKRR